MMLRLITIALKQPIALNSMFINNIVVSDKIEQIF